MTRIFHDGPLAIGDRIALSDAAAQHLLRVLRARPGDDVLLFNGTGCEVHATVGSTSNRRTELLVRARAAAAAVESPLTITLLQGVSRGERMDFVVQKATELGVTAIAPVTTERSVVRLSADQAARRHDHWRAIMIAACEQCGRTVLPLLEPVAQLAPRLAAVSRGAVQIVLTPDGDQSLADTVRGAGAVELLIGPEGGLSAMEHEAARAAGFVGVTLGPRVLRTETAALVALALVQQVAGDLSRKRSRRQDHDR